MKGPDVGGANEELERAIYLAEKIFFQSRVYGAHIREGCDAPLFPAKQPRAVRCKVGSPGRPKRCTRDEQSPVSENLAQQLLRGRQTFTDMDGTSSLSQSRWLGKRIVSTVVNMDLDN